jgi:hypothetical protein
MTAFDVFVINYKVRRTHMSRTRAAVVALKEALRRPLF